jgi:hypothetical protein
MNCIAAAHRVRVNVNGVPSAFACRATIPISANGSRVYSAPRGVPRPTHRFALIRT